MRELQTKFLKEEGALAGEALEWDRSRGGDFRCLAQAVYCIESYGSLKTAGSIVKLEKWLSESSEFSASFRQKVQDAFKLFSELVLDKKLNKVFKNPAKVSPIEFVMISLLVAVHKDRMSSAYLASAIGGMRADVRDTHVDIRMNDRVAKTMLDFIRNVGKSGVGDTAGAAGSGSGSREKRKRTDTSDDEGVNMKSKKAPAPATPKLPPTAPKYPAAHSTSSSSTSAPTYISSASIGTSAVPDRMAALRAAKLAAQNSTQNLSLNRNPPPPLILQSQSPHPLQSNGSVSSPSNAQLPSPGQTFTFPSSLNSSHQYAHAPQQQLSQISPPVPSPLSSTHKPLQSPMTPLDTSLMAQMMRPIPTPTSAMTPHPNLHTNGSQAQGYSHPPPQSDSFDRDRDRDRNRPPASSSTSDRERDRDRAPGRPYGRDDDNYSSRDRPRRLPGSGSGPNGRQSDSGWGGRGR